MTQPQIWTERTAQHLDQAEADNVTAVLGIHWRVAQLAMNIHALAVGGWNVNSSGGGDKHQHYNTGGPF